MAARVLVGTCSWTDPTLIACGRFYPPGVSSAEARLRYYASQFPLVEVDSTYYAPPSARTSALWAARTPDGFVFDVKAYALLTGHMVRRERLPAWLREALLPGRADKPTVYARDLDAAAVERLWQAHREALAPLAAAGRLGVVVFQFPPWFVRSAAAERYLAELPGRLPGLRLAVEFRGGRWLDGPATAAATFALLERLGLSYVCVDEPQGFASSTPPLTAVTAPVAVVRLHGRNRRTWQLRTSTSSERFRYLYTDAELREWVPRVEGLAREADEVHVLFNNNYEDWGVRNARRMAALLGLGAPAGGAADARQGRLDLSEE